ncbi:MAG TPA: hypothetical protein VF329_03915 [Gammaproteobacteria bacterium]
MGFLAIVILVAAVAAIALAWARKRRGRAPRRVRTASAGRSSAAAYSAVEIRAPAGACAAAKALAGKTFLASEAPALPLERCDAARCRCSFEKLPDRRQDSRRWSDEGLSPVVFDGAERRKTEDRRSNGE